MLYLQTVQDDAKKLNLPLHRARKLFVQCSIMLTHVYFFQPAKSTRDWLDGLFINEKGRLPL